MTAQHEGIDSESRSIPSAVVGVGYLGKFHAEKYLSSKRAHLRAVVDTDQPKAEKLAAELSKQAGREIKALTNYRELPLLGVTACSVASPTATHFEIASWLLQNGVDTLVEKPITTSSAEAEKLIELATKFQRKLQVGHIERFNSAFQVLKELLVRPVFFEVRRIHPFSGRGHDVDVVLDLMIHDLDIVNHLVRRPIEQLDAVGAKVLTDSFDIASARIKFEGGAVANFTSSRAALKTERTLRIFQDDIYASMDYEKKKLKITHRVVSEDGMVQIKGQELDVELRDALRDEVESFLEAIQEDKSPIVTGEDGRNALKLAELIKQSMFENLARVENAPVANVKEVNRP